MATESTTPRALVLNIQRMSTEDGPGIRTTVFLKGCGLACTWCHNPESISPKPQTVWHEWKCMGCGTCLPLCPQTALARGDDGLHIDRARCQACGTCVEACPTTALEGLGTPWELDALVAEVAKDQAYFATSGGGVTVSGGEPCLQPSFVAAFLERLAGLGLHTALDTCGFCATEALLRLAARADLVLFDVKTIDSGHHEHLTGQPNGKILERLAALAERIGRAERPRELWVRTPLVPDATATAENVRGIAAFLAARVGAALGRWELCAFNNLARDKYRRLGLEWSFATTELMTRAELGRLEAVAREAFGDASRVFATGATRVDRA